MLTSSSKRREIFSQSMLMILAPLAPLRKEGPGMSGLPASMQVSER
jgi:hypothetical protein